MSEPGMSIVEVLVLAVGLSMDAFAVAVCAGAAGRARGVRATFRISFHFGLFQFLMPVLGWLLAAAVAQAVEAFDHWVAFALLWAVGLRMVRSGWRSEGGGAEAGPERDPSKGMSLVALSVATSIDALAVGISLAMLGERILWPSIIIGCVTGLLSLLGMKAGARLGRRFGERMEIVGGLLLLGLGVNIVLAHLRP